MVRHHPQYLGCSHRRTDGASSPAGQRFHAKRLPGRALSCPHTHQGDQAAFLLPNFGAAILAASNGSKSSVRPSSERSEEHTSELQSLMRISYAVFCLKKKKISKK